MTAPHADPLIAGYLARLTDAAKELPKGPRTELIDDMRSHISEARARESGEETDATILNILDRLGEPAVVVAETRDRLGLQAVQPYRPGILEIGALILVPFLWPIGVILLWLSPAWNWRDKLIGTLLPPGGYIGIGVVGAMTAQGHSCSVLTDAAGKVLSNTCPAPSPWQGVAAAFLTFVVYVLPLVTAAYLAIRLRWGRRAEVRFA
jgi:hypothetical protein